MHNYLLAKKPGTKSKGKINNSVLIAVGTAVADGPRTDPGVRNYRTGLPRLGS